MKKGLLLTLVMVAIALSGYRAMGRAPVVNEIRDIVVGDADTATPPNTFVYPEVINLNDYVDDPDGDKADIVWSYYEPTGKYIINGVASQDSEDAQQIISPLLEKRIAGPGVTALDPLDSDSQSITITVRNKDLSPIGGPNVDPGAAGEVPDSARVITLFASDGSTVGLTKDTTDTLPSFIAYTVKGDTDHTSPISKAHPWRTWSFPNTNNGWTTTKEFTNGTVTFTTSANGICLEVTAAGQNGGEWQGSYGEATYGIELVKNSVWRCRLTASSQGTVAGEIPFWMFLYDNANTAAEQGLGRFGANGYGGEFVFLDTSSSENGAGVTPGRTDFECWLSPLPVQTAAWNSDTVGPFEPSWDAYNDMRIRFRVFDLAVGVPGADVAHGQICMSEVKVDRYDLIDMKRAASPVYEDTKIQTPAWRVLGSGTTATNDTADGGGVLVAPVLSGGRGWLTGTVQLVPGDGVMDFTTPSVDQDDFPVIWESNTLYCIEAVLSCPSAPAPGPGSTEAQGDIIRMGMDGPTNEIAYMNLIDNAYNCAGTPKATPDTFTSFFFSHTATLSGTEFARLRPRFDILNTGAHGTNGATMGTKYHSVKVTKVTFD